jgi:hypothetical protein
MFYICYNNTEVDYDTAYATREEAEAAAETWANQFEDDYGQPGAASYKIVQA